MTEQTMNTMNKAMLSTAFLLGAGAIVWMAALFLNADALAFTITVVIGAAYLIGVGELLQFRKATTSLQNALNQLPEQVTELGSWLKTLDPSLQNATQQRIEGERIGLPSPVLTPYLVGLLVMLGLLGTFFGMVDTLKGAVVALEGSSELQAIRAGLAAPIQGLGMAFGTSVAGVAASAMLGLISTLSRRERMQQTQRLDSQISRAFAKFSLVHNRQQTYKALQSQAETLPEVAKLLTTMSAQMLQTSSELSTALSQNQAQFHQTMEQRYSQLASSVEQTIEQGVSKTSQLTADSMQPILQTAISQISSNIKHNVETSQQQLNSIADKQLQAMSEKMASSTQHWLEQQHNSDQQRLANFSETLQLNQQQTADQQQQSNDKYHQQLAQLTELQETSSSNTLEKINHLMASSEQLVSQRIDTENQWLANHQQRMTELTHTIQTELNGLTEAEHARSVANGEQLALLQSTVTINLAALGKQLEAPMARLIETASETPRAAAEVISKLRSEISDNIERDNQLLEERQTLMQELNALTSSLQQSSTNQSQTLEQMVISSASMLESIGTKFSDNVNSQTSQIGDIVSQFAGSAAEMASLGEAFGVAVLQFNDSNDELKQALGNIEQALEQSSSRSDDQLGYYVAQAREIIDHSILSQKNMIEELRQLGQQEQLFTEQAS